jgi:ubiquinone/menaquinone biosynthesis C-methylase UbiE
VNVNVGTEGGSLYQDGGYLANNPTWGGEDSQWKAEQIARMLQKNGLRPRTICEVGCGAGGVIARVQSLLGADVEALGVDISPDAIALAEQWSQPNLAFQAGDIATVSQSVNGDVFDVALVIDVVEHVEDCFEFVRSVRNVANHKVFHIPLDLSLQSVARPRRLTKSWDLVGHVHFFTKETAIRLLEECGHRVVATEITAGGAFTQLDSTVARLARWPRRLVFELNANVAARTLGGCSLLALTE